MLYYFSIWDSQTSFTITMKRLSRQAMTKYIVGRGIFGYRCDRGRTHHSVLYSALTKQEIPKKGKEVQQDIQKEISCMLQEDSTNNCEVYGGVWCLYCQERYKQTGKLEERSHKVEYEKEKKYVRDAANLPVIYVPSTY